MGHPALQSSTRTLALASLKNTASGAGETAQQVKVLVTKPNLSSIPRTHKGEENRLSKWSSEHMHAVAHVPTHIHMYTNKINVTATHTHIK